MLFPWNSRGLTVGDDRSIEHVMHGTHESTYFFRGVETTPRTVKIANVVAGWVRGYMAWRKRQANIAILQGLSALQLKDIGLYPEDTGHIAGRRRFALSMEWIDPQA